MFFDNLKARKVLFEGLDEAVKDTVTDLAMNLQLQQLSYTTVCRIAYTTAYRIASTTAQMCKLPQTRTAPVALA